MQQVHQPLVLLWIYLSQACCTLGMVISKNDELRH